MQRKSEMSAISTSDYFVVRVARLPLERFFETPLHDKDLERFLLEWVDEKAVREALYIASRSFLNRLDIWRKKRSAANRAAFILSLLKYFVRITTRPTPFGLFSGISFGQFGCANELVVGTPEEDSRVTRIDASILGAIQDSISDDRPNVKIKYRTNQTAHRVGKTIHYIEPYFSRGVRNYRLSSLESDEHLSAALQIAEAPLTKRELIGAFSKRFPETSPDDVAHYVEGLVRESVLLKELPLPLTGESPERALSASLVLAGAEGIGAILNECSELLATIDESQDDPIARYEDAGAKLQSLPFTFPLDSAFQVDLYRSFTHCQIDRSEFKSLTNLFELLSVGDSDREDPLNQYAVRFAARFERRMVPLLTALDEVIGVPFASESGYESRLLAGLPFEVGTDKGDNSSRPARTPFQRFLLDTLTSTTHRSHQTVQLRSSQCERILQEGSSRIKTIPRSFAALVSLYQTQQGESIIHLKGVSGPSSANLTGRFCHLKSDLTEAVRLDLRNEELASPDVIFAEVVHLPHGRPGNVIARPVLRAYEITFMGDSSVPEQYQIPVNDLLVYVEQNIVKLWSKRLNKQIVPRLSCAHNYGTRSLGIYKFLCALGSQSSHLPKFELPTELRAARFVPRIVFDNVLLQERQWRVSRTDLEGLSSNTDTLLIDRWSHLTEKYGLPRYVTFAKADNVLAIDLKSPASVRMLLSEVKTAKDVTLKEFLPHEFRPMVTATKTSERSLHYSHEVVVPFVNTKARVEQSEFSGRIASDAPAHARVFPPGSEWLSMKLYGMPGMVEDILVDVVAPLARALTASGDLSKWFFIRYGDPEWHIRVRLQGNPETLWGSVLPELTRKLSPHLESCALRTIEIFTYERETARYGGEAGILLAEELFHVESNYVSDALRQFDSGREEFRWKFAIKSALALLERFSPSGDEAFALIDRMRTSFGAEFNETKSMRQALGRRFRELGVDRLLDPSASSDSSSVPAASELLFRQYIDAVDCIAKCYRKLSLSKGLACPLAEIVASFIHMLSNRFFRNDNRRNELVVYDFLRRHVLSVRARAGRQPGEIHD